MTNLISPLVTAVNAAGATAPAGDDQDFFSSALGFLSDVGEGLRGGFDLVSQTYADWVNFDRQVDYIEAQKDGGKVGTYQPVQSGLPVIGGMSTGTLLLLGGAAVGLYLVMKD